MSLQDDLSLDLRPAALREEYQRNELNIYKIDRTWSKALMGAVIETLMSRSTIV
jgi:hypothetical protein